MNIEELRARLRLINKAQLARETGIHVNTIRKIAKGKSDPKASTMALIEAAIRGELA